MKRARAVGLLMLSLCIGASLLRGQTSIQISGTVSNNACPYAQGSGHATLVSGNGSGTANWLVGTSPVQTPRIIQSLDSFGKFSMTLTNTSVISPGSFAPQWQFSFCSFNYPASGQVCFQMTPMALTSSQDISTQIQSQSAPIPACGGGGGGAITFEHNGVVVASEPKYNMIDSLTAIWTVVDDPANQRVNSTIAASGGGGGGAPAGVLYDVQINDPLGSFGADSGIFQEVPATHTVTDYVMSAGQQVNVSDATHSGQVCQGHSTGSAIDSAYCTQPSSTFSPTPTGGYGLFPPDNSPTALGQAVGISNLTPVNIVTQFGTLPFYKTTWGTVSGAVSLENLPYIYTDIPCNSPATCPDLVPKPIPYQANNFYAGPRAGAGQVGYLSNTVTAGTASGSATNATFTFPYPVNTGDPLVLITDTNAGTLGTPTDTCGNTWAPTSSGNAWYVASAKACTSLDTVTQSLGGTGNYISGGGEILGGGVLDVQASSGSCGSASGSTYPITFTSLTTTNIDTLVTLIVQGGAAQTGLGVYVGTNGLFIENQAKVDGGGGLGVSLSVAMGWEPALTVGSNNTTMNYTYTGSSNICSAAGAITLAFKPSATNNPANPTARDIFMDDLEQHIIAIPSDGKGLVFDAAYGTYFNLTFGSGLTYTASTHTLSTSAGGTVTSVSGTANQIDVATGTTTPVISLDSAIILPGTLTSSHNVDFSGSSSFKIPVGAGATAGAAGIMIEDSTAKNYHIYANGTDSIIAPFASAPTTGHCVQTTVSGGNVLLSDAGGACGTSTGAAFNVITSGTNITAAMVVGSGATLAPTSATAGVISANQLNGTALSGLSTGILRNTTTTGVPSAAEISGDATTSGSNALTLATVNSNVGSFTNANITVNAKGLITAAANGSGGGGTIVYKLESTNYTILSTDFTSPSTGCGTITTNAAITIKLPASPPTAGTCVFIQNYSNNTVTIDPNGSTASACTISNCFLYGGMGLKVTSDGSIYIVQKIQGGFDNGQGSTFYGMLINGTSGTDNTLFGYNIAAASGGGSFNTVVGENSAHALSSGQFNTVMGLSAGSSLSSGSGNTIIGSRNEDASLTGSTNLLIGGDNQCFTPGSTTSNYLCLNDEIYGDVSKGILIFKGPTTTIASNACGSTTQGTLKTGSNDMTGEVTVGTAAVTSCAVSFANTHNVAPNCIVSSQVSGTVVGLGYTVSTTALTVTATSGFSSTVFDYFCPAGSTSSHPTP